MSAIDNLSKLLKFAATADEEEQFSRALEKLILYSNELGYVVYTAWIKFTGQPVYLRHNSFEDTVEANMVPDSAIVLSAPTCRVSYPRATVHWIYICRKVKI